MIDFIRVIYPTDCMNTEKEIKLEKPEFTLGDVVWVITKCPKKITECVVDSIRYDTFLGKKRVTYTVLRKDNYEKTDYFQGDVYDSYETALTSIRNWERSRLENLLKDLEISEDKIKKGLDIIFSEDENELDSEDFKELPQGDEILTIPEHTSFWKSIWEGSKAVWEGK